MRRLVLGPAPLALALSCIPATWLLAQQQSTSSEAQTAQAAQENLQAVRDMGS